MTQKEAIDIFKRFFIMFLLIGIPLIIVLTLVAKLSSILVIVITVVSFGAVFGLEEYLHFKRLKKKQEKRKGDK